MFEEIPQNPTAMRKRIQFIYREIEQKIGNSRDGEQCKILDIGCGTGAFVTMPLGRLGVSVLGIDIHLPSIAWAIKQNPFPNVSFECTTIEDLADNQFDVIICSEILEHLENPEGMLHSVKGILKEDGIFIVTIPNGYGPKEMEKRFFRPLHWLFRVMHLLEPMRSLRRLIAVRVKPEKYGKEVERDYRWKDTLNTESPHVQFFTLGHFRKLLRQCGFTVLKVENRRFISGPITDAVMALSPRLCDWNVKVAGPLPHWLASSWLFVTRPCNQTNPFTL